MNDMAKISDRLIRWVLSRKNVHLYLMCADRSGSFSVPCPKIGKDGLPRVRSPIITISSLTWISAWPLLRIQPFNRSRSDVKFLEYAVHGVVPVVQATGPYLHSVKQGRTGFFFNSTDELISTLDHLVCDVSARIRVSASAREYVLRERNYKDRGPDRVEFYRSLIAAGTQGCEPSGTGRAETFARLCDCAGAKKKGRHLLLGSTRYELLLQSGILSDP